MQFFDTSCQLATEQEKTQKLKNQEGNWYSNNSSSQKQQLSDLLWELRVARKLLEQESSCTS